MSTNPYLDTGIRTADPVQLVVQLYDGALRFMQQAKEHHAAERVLERGHAIGRALAIVHELQGSLDFERGAEIARNLDALYRFAADQLFEANRSRRIECVDAALAAIAPLRDAWAAIANGEVSRDGTDAG